MKEAVCGISTSNQHQTTYFCESFGLHTDQAISAVVFIYSLVLFSSSTFYLVSLINSLLPNPALPVPIRLSIFLWDPLFFPTTSFYLDWARQMQVSSCCAHLLYISLSPCHQLATRYIGEEGCLCLR